VSRSDCWKYAPALHDDKAEDLAGSFFAQIFCEVSISCTRCTGHRVKGTEPDWLNGGCAFLADAIQAPPDSLQYLFDCSELVPSRIVDGLQGLIVLQLGRSIAPVGDQWVATSLQIGFHPLVALA
jgi:hypothetical protein